MFLQPRPVPMIIKDDCSMQPSHQYYWEINVSHIKYRYSSDGWFGVGTKEVTQLDATNLIQNSSSKDNFWGYGSNGTVTHNNHIRQYGPHFHEGDTLGAHLDLYRGTLEFHRNRKPLGVAFTGIPTNVTLFPILIGATAIPTPSDMIGPHQFSPSLELLCYQQLAKRMTQPDILRRVPPGLAPLLKAFEFLHYCTGDPPNPILHSSNFEMMIASDSEEENSVASRRVRKKKVERLVAHNTRSSVWSDFDSMINVKSRGRPQRRRPPQSDDQPSCSTWDTTRHQQQAQSASKRKKLVQNCNTTRQQAQSPSKGKKFDQKKVRTRTKTQKTSLDSALSTSLEEKSPKTPALVNAAVSPRVLRSVRSTQRKSERVVKKNVCGCCNNC